MSPSEPTLNGVSSETYPSADGSDVDRSSSFWSLPSVISSPAASGQSVAANLSEPDCDGLGVIMTFPSEALGHKLLEEWEDWFVTTLYPKLLATERAYIEVEKLRAEIDKENAAIKAGRCEAALARVTDTMEAQGLRLKITRKSNHGAGRRRGVHNNDDDDDKVEWELYMDGDRVWSGEAEGSGEVLCSAFFSARRDVLKRSWYYRHSNLE